MRFLKKPSSFKVKENFELRKLSSKNVKVGRQDWLKKINCIYNLQDSLKTNFDVSSE